MRIISSDFMLPLIPCSYVAVRHGGYETYETGDIQWLRPESVYAISVSSFLHPSSCLSRSVDRLAEGIVCECNGRDGRS